MTTTKPFRKTPTFTTILPFVKGKGRHYTPKDMHEIGKTLVGLYRMEFRRDPLTVQQVEHKEIVTVNLYPYRWRHEIKKVVEEYFEKRPK
jgi:hypothetical protein